MISVLILTYNEELNLPRCLDSVAWSDDVLVLDSFSSDRTVEIAKQRNVRVCQRKFDHFAGQRNFGLEHGGLKYDWVLHLDADEMVPQKLRAELMEAANCGSNAAYRLASKMIFRGRWLRYSGLYPTYQVRFGRKEQLVFVQVGHGQRENLPPDQIGTLREPVLHYSFAKGLDDWRAKHCRYAEAEAEHALRNAGSKLDLAGLVSLSDAVRRRRALKTLSSRLPLRPPLRFAYMYLLRLGFLDGKAGFEYCRLLAWYERMIVTKTKELRARG